MLPRSPNGFSLNFVLENFCRKSVEKFQISLTCAKSVAGTVNDYVYDDMSLKYSKNEKIFHTTFVEKMKKKWKWKMKTHFVCRIISGKSCFLWDNMENFGRARHGTGGNDYEERMSLHAGFFCFWRHSPPVGQDLIFYEVSRSHTKTFHIRLDSSGRVISSSQRLLPANTQHSQ